jgi:hypothetical protein
VVLDIKNGEIEENLFPGFDPDDPGAFPTMVVVVWPALCQLLQLFTRFSMTIRQSKLERLSFTSVFSHV